jgi:Tol biopolymer transport system component
VQLTNGQFDGPPGIAPLSDGRVGYISRVGENLTLWVMNSDGSDQHQIGLPLTYLEELRATPDGRFFIFSGRRDRFSHLYRIDTNGRDLKQLTYGETNEISSTISPDSKWVFYIAKVHDSERPKAYLRKISIDGGETVNLKEMESDLVPELSPDGKSIAAFIGGRLKFFSSSDGTLLKTLEADKLAVQWSAPKWTPDGRSITYQVHGDNASHISVQSLSGSAPSPFTNFQKGYVYEYAFSHDGTKLYVARGSVIRDAVMIKNF